MKNRTLSFEFIDDINFGDAVQKPVSKTDDNLNFKFIDDINFNNVAVSNNIATYSGNNYRPSEYIKSYIKQQEGFSSTWYKDGNGRSIGYGFYSGGAGRNWRYDRMTRQQADQLFEQILPEYERYARKLPNYNKMSDRQKDGWVDAFYNIGPGLILNNRNLIAALSNQDWKRAANILRTIHVGNGELRNRRSVEAEMIKG